VESLKLDGHVRSRLRKEIVIWLATSRRDGKPQVVPVWFWWDGTSFLIYSVPGQKVRDIESNPRVQLHLNSDPEGGDVVRIDGVARLAPDEVAAFRAPAYVRKYRTYIADNGWTPKSFSQLYHVAIRVSPTRVL
jgi:PPOX class probable F420-dependent enzyme